MSLDESNRVGRGLHRHKREKKGYHHDKKNTETKPAIARRGILAWQAVRALLVSRPALAAPTGEISVFALEIENG